MHDLAFLSQAAVGFLDLSPKDDIYRFIGAQLKRLAGNSIIFVNSFDRATDRVCVRAVLGLGRKAGALARMLGRHPTGTSLAIDEDARNGLSKGKIEKVPGGLYEFSFRKIPKVACRAIENLLDVGNIYAMGFARKRELFGSASILTRKGTELKNQALIEAFIRQASVALQRRQAEEALQQAHDNLETQVNQRTENLRAEITERKRAEKTLKESEERYRALVNLGGAVGEAIVMLQDTERSDAIQTFASNGWSHITGYSEEELLGMSFLDLLHPKHHEAVLKRHKRKVSGESIPEYFEMSITRKDGTEVPIELTSAFTTYKGKRANVAFIRDVTQRKGMEKRLRRLYESEKKEREELEKEQEARGLSINVIAHDLRTPLAPLLASARLLKDILPSDEERPEHELVELIVRGGEALSARLDELLDLARFTVGAFSVNLKPLDIGATVKEIAKQYEESCRVKKQNIVLDLPQKLPLVKADRARLEQVLTNLISNAIKFSPEASSITIRAEAKRGKVVVGVEDEGKGLTLEEQERIFEPYHRVEQDRQQFLGLGLGLAICKQIVEVHKGRIWVESNLGTGSKFCFSLPVWNKRE